MKTDIHTTPLTVGYFRKILWWLVPVTIIGCCAALLFYSPFYSLLQPVVKTLSSNAVGSRLADKGKTNNSQINNSGLLIDHNCSRYVVLGKANELGLGNRMFRFAAALHVADLTGREFVLFENPNASLVAAAFDVNIRMVEDVCPKYTFTESIISFDARLEKLVVNNSDTVNKTIVINGYFQSWKYLRLIKDSIRYQFKFRPDTRQVATKFLKANIPPGWTNDFLRVGIHVRRGDFISADGIRFGFSAGTEEYFQKAMKYFVPRYGRTQFIVASMDTHWATTYIYFNDSALANVTFSFGHTGVQDMAILSMCDHVIVSTGTFGWWSGWLAGGTTIVYARYPREKSTFFGLLKREDYYPTNWIPME